jgi:hypothetical protein
MDPVAGVQDVLLDGAPLATGCTSITLNISNDGAAADFALGSARRRRRACAWAR